MIDFALALETSDFRMEVDRDLNRYEQISEEIKRNYPDGKYRGVSKNDVLKFEKRRSTSTIKNAFGNMITVKPTDRERSFVIESTYNRIPCVKMAVMGAQYLIDSIKVNGVVVAQHNKIDKAAIIKQCDKPSAKVTFTYR